MNARFPKSVIAAVLLSGTALASVAVAAHAQAVFSPPARASEARVSFAAVGGGPIIAGSEVVVTGQSFGAGQPVGLFYGPTPLPAGQMTANGEGEFEARFTLPTGASVGTHPIVVVSQAPYNATVVNLKISPNLGEIGTGDYNIARATVRAGMYQSAYSAKSDVLFVTAAVGRPPVTDSELLRLDPRTLEITARVTPAAAPAGRSGSGEERDGGVYAVYGVGVDDANDTVWVSNSRQNSVAVYRQSDLSLVRQYEPGTVNHARDVVVDQEDGKAYASATFANEVVVFDTASLEVVRRILIKTQAGGRGQSQTFSAASMSYDRVARRLYVVSNSTNEVAVINTRTDEVEHVFPVPGARGAIGISHDPVTDRIFVAAQGTDNLTILSGADGSVIADTPVGAGALNVVFDTVSRQAYVSNRGSSTVTVVDAEGQIVANFINASSANHIVADGKGAVFVVNKTVGQSDPYGNTVWRIELRR